MGNDGYGDLQVDLLGSWQLRRDRDLVHVAARQQRLIAVLAIRGPSLRSYLVGLLWPEYPETRALESLRVSVHLVSRQVPGLLVKDGNVLSLSEEVHVDLHRVRAQIRDLDRIRPNGKFAPWLYDLRGAELLPGWYEDWVLFEQIRLRQDRLHAFTLISRESLNRCDYEAAVEAAEAAVEIEPLYETAVGLYIQAEMHQGNTASALLAFERYQRQLRQDMGIEPSETLRRLVADVHGGRTHTANERLVLAGPAWLGRQPLPHNP
ncbi:MULTISPECIES: AfsR/SARP family transcriptional regulator [unclassified Arthrobacter]|uniref:AfsR/SARP family transcriptional regulator n=1 Tax=unclassified Arthrobacter TaxID=235627 RepID=UPI002E026141|nr:MULTISPECIES: BTAD domain-containing putative transcriptional regulator [unclassified Arthrobacter]MEC5193153.1 DNA-binding SARP family transcriptional activator [Arthrobacter sp. MP_M4]MEC5202448.1 DNA-binding SARP family transcriptional activator [Arthrobacter sp. MP_M7]